MIAFLLIIIALITIFLKIVLHLDYLRVSERIHSISKLSDIDPGKVFHAFSPVFIRDREKERKIPGLEEKSLSILIVLIIFYASIMGFFIYVNLN